MSKPTSKQGALNLLEKASPKTSEEEWHKVRTKIYYAEYRRGKVGELVDCWAYNHRLREGELIVRYPNGQIGIADEREFFRDYEEVKE